MQVEQYIRKNYTSQVNQALSRCLFSASSENLVWGRGVNYFSTFHQDMYAFITKDEQYINDPVPIANTFNNFFTSFVHSKIKFSSKSFRNFLSLEINDSFITTSKNKEEIYNHLLIAINLVGLTVFQLKFCIFFKTKYQTILQLFVTYHSLQWFFLLFWRQPKLFPFTKRILN